MTGSGSEILLEVNSLTRRFQGLIAVNDVSFSVGRGELVGLIGPNGAGKTTLFNLISGYGRPSSGSIRLSGEEIAGLSSTAIAKRGVSRTFQNLRVFPTMTVFDNVSIGAIGGVGYGWWRPLLPVDIGGRGEVISKRTWNALERAELTDVAESLASTLSYGRRKYLEIARALATRPTLLFLDEPAAGLNEAETSRLAEFVAALSQEGITIILVEHDMNFVMSLCSRILVLAAGQLIADGPPKSVASAPEVLRVYLGGSR